MLLSSPFQEPPSHCNTSSGDDHDYCVHYHPTTIQGGAEPVREVSVKSISMAMGIRRPGFQLLSLAPWDDGQRDRPHPTHTDVPCLLPDQLGIYLSVYIPLLLVSLIVVFVANVLRVRESRSMKSPRQQARRSSSPLPLMKVTIRSEVEPRQIQRAESEENILESTSFVLPCPVSAFSGRYLDQHIWSFHVFGRRRQIRACKLAPVPFFSCLDEEQGSRRHRRLSFLVASLLDIKDIAIFPLAIFVAISLYVTLS
jgi:hypothetical protein